MTSPKERQNIVIKMFQELGVPVKVVETQVMKPWERENMKPWQREKWIEAAKEPLVSKTAAKGEQNG
jgi:hypothetical protein